MANATTKKMMEKLRGLPGAVQGFKNVHEYVLRSKSPSLNFTFGNGHGLPAGYTLTLFGPPKAGKSVICNSIIGQLHQDDPDAVAVKFNTEYREQGQLSEEQAIKMWSMDPERYIAFETNRPDEVFDRIETDLLAMSQNGLKIKLIIIDSLNSIQGRRGMNADTIMTQQIGDNAITLQEGLKRILPVQRKLDCGLIITSHVRAQMDPVEIRRGNTVKSALSFGPQHHSEYTLFVEANKNKEGKEDLQGNTFYDESVKSFTDKGEKTGHKIRVKMVDSSMGPKERTGEFTFDYHKGIINIHEEVFRLGTGYNIIQKPNNVTYQYGGKDYRGKGAMLEAIKNDPKMQEEILTELRRRDQHNELGTGAMSPPVDEESPDVV
jgi:hypothetical protein